MAIGLLALTNHTLLKEILAEYPEAIRSVPDFIARIKPGKTFFNVRVTPETGGVYIHEILLSSTKKYSGNYSEFKNHMMYVAKYDSQREHFLDDLMHGGCVCFLDKKHAESYRDKIRKNLNILIGMI